MWIMEIKIMISVDTLKSLESLSLYPEKSSEAISDQMDTTVPGGELASDSTTGKHLHFREKGLILLVIVKRFTR